MLAQVAKLLLPIRELAVALLHLTLLLVELPPRFRRGLLALPKLLAKLLEVALVGRQQLALLVDRLLALVQRDLERCPTGSRVVPILRRADCAAPRRRALSVASSSSWRAASVALLLVALA